MAASRLTPIQWLICAIAAIGFAFDIYELLMLPLIIKPAIAALSAPLVDQLVAGGMPRPQAMALWVPGGSQYVSWARTLFFVPAMVGGVFGLLGGYLTDRLGRRRVLTFSILLYALSAFAAGFVDVARAAAGAALRRVRRRLRRVRGRGGVAGRAVRRSEAAREGPRLHPGVLVGRRHPGRRRQRDRREHRHQPAGDSRRTRSVALHADLRRHSGAAADRDPAVPAGVAGVGGQARRRPAAAAEHRRAVRPRPGAHDDRHDDRLRRELRHRLRGDPAAAADPRRAEPRPRRDRRHRRRGAAAGHRRRDREGTAGAAGAATAPDRRQRHGSGCRHRVVLAGDGRPGRPRRLRAHRGLGDQPGARCCASSRSRR